MASMNPNPFAVLLQNSAPTAIAPTAVVAPVLHALPATAAHAPSPSNTEHATAWTEAVGRPSLPPSPDASGAIRAALLKLRRAQLTRVVKAVVLASALVCVAAMARLALSAAAPDAETHAAAPSIRARQDLVRSVVRTQVDALSERTLRAMAAPVAPAKRSPAHLTASRGHKRW